MIVLLIFLIIFGILLLTYIIKYIWTDNIIHEELNKNLNPTQNKHLKYIPKKIFQLIRDKNNIEPEFKENIEYIKKLNPNWEYILYDNSDHIPYIQKYYPRCIVEIYNKINPKYGACRADFFRYLLMYVEGGVYLDIKSAMKYGLDHIIFSGDEYILSHWPNHFTMKYETNNMFGELQQWHIICRPKHPYLKKVIEDVIDNIVNYDIEKFGVGKLGVLKVTGPITYTNSIIPIQHKYNHRIIENNNYIGLIYNNTKVDHTKIFKDIHYSRIKESIILSE